MTIFVDKIWSYQTLVYKNGTRTFRKKQYIDYINEITRQIEPMPSFNGEVDISIKFNCKTRTVGDIDNITKPILDTLQMAGKIKNDKLIVVLHLEKHYGASENSVDIEIKAL